MGGFIKESWDYKSHSLGPVILRITLGILWLEMGIQKLHPNFMKGLESKLRFWAEENPYPWYKYFLENFAIPHWQAFGYQVMLGEILVGLSLIFGILTGLSSFFGFLMIMNFYFASSYAEGERAWFFWIIAVSHMVVMLTRAGRAFGIDYFLSKRFPRSLLW
ncbi:MAG: TQO small subunit DoxD [Nitrospirota bacterium]